MFIRYLADTSTTPLAEQAIEYLHALLRIAPVRVGSMSAGLSGRWEHYTSLLATPMTGTFINVVCTDPVRWMFEHTVTAPLKNGRPERFVNRISLHTINIRNVLIAPEVARTPEQVATARQYECLIVPSETHRMQWEMNGAPGAIVIPTPVTDHDAFRAAVLG